MRANKCIYLALDVRGQESGAHVFRRPTIVENWRFLSVGTDDKISGRSITSKVVKYGLRERIAARSIVGATLVPA
jgi:hypothetical protein